MFISDTQGKSHRPHLELIPSPQTESQMISKSGALMISLLSTLTIGWTNSRFVGELKCHDVSMTSRQWTFLSHWNGNVIKLTKFSSMVALKVVNTKTPSAAIGEHFVKMMTFPTEMSSFWQNFHQWLHWKSSIRQLPVQPLMKISSKWWHFRQLPVQSMMKISSKWWHFRFSSCTLFSDHGVRVKPSVPADPACDSRFSSGGDVGDRPDERRGHPRTKREGQIFLLPRHRQPSFPCPGELRKHDALVSAYL